MKCFNHDTRDALAICANCGKALCRECAGLFIKEKIVCGQACSQAVSEQADMLTTIRRKILRQSKVGAYTLFSLGGIFMAFGVFNAFRPGWGDLAAYLIASAVGMGIAGVMAYRVATRTQ